MQEITTVDAAVEAFGGTVKTSEIFGVSPPAVSNWKKAGKFPKRQHYRISREAEKRGLSLKTELFDEDSEAA